MAPSELAEALHTLRTEGGSCNRMLVRMGVAWFMFWGARGRRQVRCEAAAKIWLPETLPMGIAQIDRLRSAGFRRDGRARLLARDFDGEASSILGEVLPLFHAVYGQSGEPTFELYLGETEALENSRLMDAMRRVSQERSQDARQGVYRALIRADLLVPIDAEGEMVQMGTLGDRPVYGVFTDWDSLRSWDPRVPPYRRVRGSAFFLGLAQTSAGSVLINPQGQVGGELYRNEILAIAGAIRGVRGGG